MNATCGIRMPDGKVIFFSKSKQPLMVRPEDLRLDRPPLYYNWLKHFFHGTTSMKEIEEAVAVGIDAIATLFCRTFPQAKMYYDSLEPRHQHSDHLVYGLIEMVDDWLLKESEWMFVQHGTAYFDLAIQQKLYHILLLRNEMALYARAIGKAILLHWEI
jgi:hypothetical protein